MQTEQKPIPRIVIQSIGGGLFLMAFFTMMWTGIAQSGLQGRDHYLTLVAFAGLCLVFIVYGTALFIIARRYPVFTTEADKTEGKKISKKFGIIFGVEGTLIPIVCIILKLFSHEQLILPAIALIVGLHFYPMARIFKRTLDYYLAAWSSLIAIAGILFTIRHSFPDATIIASLGIGMAMATSSYGIYMLLAGYKLTTIGRDF